MKKEKILVALILFALCLSSIIPAGAAEWRTQKLDALYRDIKIFLFGEQITPTDVNGKAVEPFIVDGTTYVPLRAIGEAFGLDVSWDSDTATIHISDLEAPYYPQKPPEPSKTVEVSTAEELVKAIAPDTCITLKAGKYDVSKVTGVGNEYIYWRDDYYGQNEKTLVIEGVVGLTLQAAPGADVEIVTPWRFAKVLEFLYCNGVKLSGIKAGHTVTGDYECDEGVVGFRDSYNISVENCLFYGSGTIGIVIENCISAQISNTTMTDCSRCAVEIIYSDDIVFDSCRFIDNRAYDGVIIGHESSAEFIDCVITGNKSLEYGGVVAFSNALFERCLFRDNAHLNVYDSSGAVLNGQNLRLRNCEIEKGNFDKYWDSGVVDLGGNKLT